MSTDAKPPLAGATGSAVRRLPSLRILRDANPVTGQVWVVDENNHQVACFRIKKPECHLSGATTEVFDAWRNMMMARALIEHLSFVWSTNEDQSPNAPASATGCQEGQQ